MKSDFEIVKIHEYVFSKSHFEKIVDEIQKMINEEVGFLYLSVLEDILLLPNEFTLSPEAVTDLVDHVKPIVTIPIA